MRTTRIIAVVAVIGLGLTGCNGSYPRHATGRSHSPDASPAPAPTRIQRGTITIAEPAGDDGCRYTFQPSGGAKPWTAEFDGTHNGPCYPASRITGYEVYSDGEVRVTVNIRFYLDKREIPDPQKPLDCTLTFKAGEDEPGTWFDESYFPNQHPGHHLECQTLQLDASRTFREDDRLGQLTASQLKLLQRAKR
jgi:hypothetical protein